MNKIEDVAKIMGARMTTYGILTIVLGVLAMLLPVVTGFSIIILLGVIVLCAGIFRIIWAFQSDTLGRGVLAFVLGGLTFLCGLLLLVNPAGISGMLTVLLSIYFIIDGIFEIVAGVRQRPVDGWGWLLFSGIVSLLLGIMVWKQYPLSGAWALGMLIGIKLVLIGLIMVMGGSAVRSLGGREKKPV